MDPTRITVRVPMIATPGGEDEAVPVVVSTVRSTVGPFSFTVVRGILIASDREGDFDVHIMNSDGSRPENLTGHPAMDGRPAWSPDGTRIAFQSDRDGDYEVYSMDADGGNVVELADRHRAEDGQPAWGD